VTRRFVALAVILVLGMTARAQSVSIQLDNNAFKVVGWQAPSAPPSGGWPSVLAVYAGPGTLPIIGRYAVENGMLVFRPQYPLAAGVRYRAVFHQPGQTQPVEQIFDGPRQSTTPVARVERVYPSADVLPSNQLRLYIYFSVPMSRGELPGRIHILDKDGQEVRAVFLPGQELWDPNNQRLTMTFDPGRIKRDVASNVAMGPPLVDGRQYTLVIDKSWPDADGNPMVASFRKPFRGGPAIRVPPSPKEWRITSPASGTSTPLVVDFGRSMNYALLPRMLKVTGPRGSTVAGTIAVARNESEWRFTPGAAWTAGAYQLIVDKDLEDLAGNKIDQPFDIDVFQQVTERITTTTVPVPFTVR
jgi:hypothetical protein